ncbi:MAG: dihydropteroate synthase [Ideonella sp.]|jgi:dihydropteroate synthase|nr:dihydropteroate synthase [Ideonella sp.]
MAIVNVTPDSFWEGGRGVDPAEALARCRAAVEEGADLLDLGAESTRPGAPPVPADEELRRLLPVLEGALGLGVPVSVDTRKAPVMTAALAAGADVVNDVQALQDPGALEALAAHPRAGVCLMHMQGTPQSMQVAPAYRDVVGEVVQFLAERVAAAEQAGVSRDRLVVDPGFGFGKTVDHNLALWRQLERLLPLAQGILVGWSRKSTLGHLTGRPAGDRLPASLAAALASVQRGARIVRVHDVAATVDALRVWGQSGLIE